MTTETKARRMKVSCLSCRTQWKARLWVLDEERDVLISSCALGDEVYLGVKWADCPNPACRCSKIVSFSFS